MQQSVRLFDDDETAMHPRVADIVERVVATRSCQWYIVTLQVKVDAMEHQHQRLSADATISLIHDSLGKKFRMDFLCIEGPNIPRGTMVFNMKEFESTESNGPHRFWQVRVPVAGVSITEVPE